MEKIHWLFFAAVIIAGGLMVHLFSRLARGEIDVFYANLTAMTASLIVSFIAYTIFSEQGSIANASIKGVALSALVGVSSAIATIGIFAMYRAGAPMSVAVPLTRSGVATISILFGVFLLAEKLTALNMAGVVLSIVAIILMSL